LPLGVERLKQIELLAVIRARGISRRRTNTAMLFEMQIVRRRFR